MDNSMQGVRGTSARAYAAKTGSPLHDSMPISSHRVGEHYSKVPPLYPPEYNDRGERESDEIFNMVSPIDNTAAVT